MKEFALKHPWMTFFLVDGIVSGIVKIVCTALNRGQTDTTVEVPVEITAEIKEDEKGETAE